ncbi:15428_t:CDS:2, partial [Cetraspora pellucida]
MINDILFNNLPTEGIQALQQFLTIWKDNPIPNSTIEITPQNISIINAEGLNENFLEEFTIVPFTEDNINITTEQNNEVDNNNESLIEQIKRDLEHEIEDRVLPNSPYNGSNYVQILRQIIRKIRILGKRKVNRVKRLEAIYYLGKLKDENEGNRKIIQNIRKQLTEHFGKHKSARIWKQATRIYSIYQKFGLQQLHKANFISASIIVVQEGGRKFEQVGATEEETEASISETIEEGVGGLDICENKRPKE